MIRPLMPHGLWGLAALSLLVTWLAMRRWGPRRTPLVTAWRIALLGVASLGLAELGLRLLVQLAAPTGANFNDLRLVLLHQWSGRTLWLVAASLPLTAGLTWLTLRRSAGWRLPVGLVLRAWIAILVIGLVLAPAVELRDLAKVPNHVLVLIDGSASMRLRPKANAPSRLERAQALLEASRAAITAWEAEHLVDVYYFADGLVESATLSATDPRARASNLRKALETFSQQHSAKEIAGIVLISDGNLTEGQEPQGGISEIQDVLRPLDTALHTVFMGNPELPDLEISQLDIEDLAFVRTATRVGATVRLMGEGPGRTLSATLAADGVELRSKPVTVPSGGRPVRVDFEVTPPRVGQIYYEIRIAPLPDEAVTSNNRQGRSVRIVRDKLRVLHLAGQPTWDQRALRHYLKSTPNIDLIAFFILRTNEDIATAADDELALIDFPTKELFEEQLPSFDVIIIQNFEYLPYGLAPYLESIRAFVAGGGGLVMVGGPTSFTSGGYADTPLAAALPVTLRDTDYPATLDTQEFTPVLTREGRSHPLMALRFEAEANAAAWAALPALDGTNLVAGLKPEAQALLTHPRLTTAQGQPHPLVAVMEYQQGRSLAVTTDTTWYWGFQAAGRRGDDGRAYAQFWEHALRWLVRDPDTRHLTLTVSNTRPSDGANHAHVVARLLGPDYQPWPNHPLELELRPSDAAAPPLMKAQVTTDAQGYATYTLPALPSGTYRLHASASLGHRVLTAQELVVEAERLPEFEHPGGNPDLLARLAKLSGGAALLNPTHLPVDLALSAPPSHRVQERLDVELWSHPLVLWTLLLLLGLDWYLRQRAGHV